ncbi:MAG: hypothetical protein QXR48_03295 [Candidatus Woesearchaeota archaeon]
MYIFGIDVQLNILIAFNILATLIEFLLVWKISRKIKTRPEHRAVQKRIAEEEEEVSGE